MPRHVTFHECPTRTYIHPSQAGYRNPAAGHEPVRDVGPTPEMLDEMEQTAAGAILIRRTGPASYAIVR